MCLSSRENGGKAETYFSDSRFEENFKRFHYWTDDQVLVNIMRKNSEQTAKSDEATDQVYWKQKYTLKSESTLSD